MTTFLKTLLMDSRKTSALLPSNFNLSTRWFCAKPQRSEESKIDQNDLAAVTTQVIYTIMIKQQIIVVILISDHSRPSSSLYL
jgi:hypothetical protein